MQSWQDADIKYVLREAEKLLLDTAYQLRLPVKVRLPLYSRLAQCLLALRGGEVFHPVWSISVYNRLAYVHLRQPSTSSNIVA